MSEISAEGLQNVLFRNPGSQAFARSSELPAWLTKEPWIAVTLDAVVLLAGGSLSVCIIRTRKLPVYATFTHKYSEGRLSRTYFTKHCGDMWWLWGFDSCYATANASNLHGEGDRVLELRNSWFIEREWYSRLLLKRSCSFVLATWFQVPAICHPPKRSKFPYDL